MKTYEMINELRRELELKRNAKSRRSERKVMYFCFGLFWLVIALKAWGLL
jgi:hypothetical protein